MIFNLGATKLLVKFKKLQKAIKEEKWDVAAIESRRTKIDESRNLYVKKLFMDIHLLFSIDDIG